MWDRLLVICTIDSHELFESWAESPLSFNHLARLDAVGVAHFLDRQRARLVVAVDDPHPAVREQGETIEQQDERIDELERGTMTKTPRNSSTSELMRRSLNSVTSGSPVSPSVKYSTH